jgi:hypothetical protein
MTDLFGEEVVLIAKATGKRVTGYAAPPGTGPAGETCKTCEHFWRKRGHSKVYRKCGHPKAHRSNCTATDIKASALACRLWERAADMGAT